jgi:Uma2 family endonuclease
MTQVIQTDPLATPPAMTYEEFLDWSNEDIRAEWVEGRVVFMSPVSRQHQSISRFLLKLISYLVEENGLGEVFYESFQMKTAPNLPGREPDILFVSTANLSRLRPNRVEGPADLVVEIVSPDDPDRDRIAKFGEYQQGGVHEYWLIDPETRQGDFYLRNDAGVFENIPIENGIFRSHILEGLWLRTEWLWQEPKPTLLDVLREWGMIS